MSITLEFPPPEQARALCADLDHVCAQAFAGPPYYRDAAANASSFARFNAQTRKPGFALVVARDANGRIVGLIFGYPLPATTGWWNNVLEPVSPKTSREDGRRSFGVFELAVVPGRQRQGIATRLHAALSERIDRDCERLVLNCRPDAAAAQAAYRSWGYRRVTSTIPWPSAPVYDVLVCLISRD